MVDSGSVENMLSKKFYDRMPKPIQRLLKPSSFSARVADGTQLPIYGTIELKFQLRNKATSAIFQVADITDTAILGMRFFREHGGVLHASHGYFTYDNNSISCVSKEGENLSTKVRAVQEVTVPGNGNVHFDCAITTPISSSSGTLSVCGQSGLTLDTPSAEVRPDGTLTVCCINSSNRPITLHHGSAIGIFSPKDVRRTSKVGLKGRAINLITPPVLGRVIRGPGFLATNNSIEQITTNDSEDHLPEDPPNQSKGDTLEAITESSEEIASPSNGEAPFSKISDACNEWTNESIGPSIKGSAAADCSSESRQHSKKQQSCAKAFHRWLQTKLGKR